MGQNLQSHGTDKNVTGINGEIITVQTIRRPRNISRKKYLRGINYTCGYER